MGLITDLKLAIEDYPREVVDIEIVDVTFDGNRINVGETGSFRVKVTNRGALNMTGVSVRVRGRNGTRVKHGGAAAQFDTEFIYAMPDPINAHASRTSEGSPLKFEAPSVPSAPVDLISVTIEDWDANLEHILVDHSEPVDEPEGVLRARVIGA